MAPPYWIKYCYLSPVRTVTVYKFAFNGKTYLAKDIAYPTVNIDPRGHFTMIRCSIIIMLDKLMVHIGFRKPFVEFCELLANYPTW
jgi:hypothetical protein